MNKSLFRSSFRSYQKNTSKSVVGGKEKWLHDGLWSNKKRGKNGSFFKKIHSYLLIHTIVEKNHLWSTHNHQQLHMQICLVPCSISITYQKYFEKVTQITIHNHFVWNIRMPIGASIAAAAAAVFFFVISWLFLSCAAENSAQLRRSAGYGTQPLRLVECDTFKWTDKCSEIVI